MTTFTPRDAADTAYETANALYRGADEVFALALYILVKHRMEESDVFAEIARERLSCAEKYSSNVLEGKYK